MMSFGKSSQREEKSVLLSASEDLFWAGDTLARLSEAAERDVQTQIATHVVQRLNA